MKTMVENAIDNVKLSAEPLPVILVGGGGIILNIETVAVKTFILQVSILS
jgi:hypothetical protein